MMGLWVKTPIIMWRLSPLPYNLWQKYEYTGLQLKYPNGHENCMTAVTKRCVATPKICETKLSKT